MSQPRMRAVVFDLETAGLTMDAPIIQIAAQAVTMPDFTVLDVPFQRKLRFDPNDSNVSPEALEINSYDANVWAKEAIDPRAAMVAFSEYVKRYADLEMISKRTGNPYSVARLVGYNSQGFDMPRIWDAAKRWNLFLAAHPISLDVMQLAAWRYPNAKSLKLQDVCEAAGLLVEDAHDALGDVKATIDLAQLLLAQPEEIAA